MTRRDPMILNDRKPFWYIRVMERKIDVNGFSSLVDAELSAYTSVKLSGRHESNTEDVNDHNKDDIFADFTLDTGNLAHFEWGDTAGTDQLFKVGEWSFIVVLEPTAGFLQHHHETFVMSVLNQSRIGTTLE